MHISFTDSPKEGELNFLMQKINEEHPDKPGATSFAFFARDAQNALIAGCNGYLLFGALHIDQLWVDPAYRKKGLGKLLMEKAHAYGRTMGCTLATVHTMSFQHARAFYEKLGYVCDFERKGYSGNSSFIALRKELH